MPAFIRRWLLIALVPYAMYLVAYVFESRIPVKDVPLWKGQSKAFFPGDAAFAVFVAMTGEFDYPPPPRNRVLGITVGVIALFIIRRLTYKPEDYTPQQWRSPSKVYHDVVVCLFFGYLAVTRCVPFYLQTRLSDHFVEKVIGLSGLAMWIGGAIWDELHEEVPNPKQHPDTWRLIRGNRTLATLFR